MLVDRKSLPDEFDLCAIDTDIVVYQCAFSAQKTMYDVFSDGEVLNTLSSKKECQEYIEQLEFEGTYNATYEKRLVVGTAEEAYEAVDTLIKYIKRQVNAKEYRLYLTDSASNYRNAIAVTKPYKGNREELEKPVFYSEVKEYLQKEYGAYMVVGVEADDAVSVLGCAKGGRTTCVATIDKDLMGSPITLYNFGRDEWHQISEEEADKFFFIQCLTGDATDNIEGLKDVSLEFRQKHGLPKRKGVGKVTAEKLLEGLTEASEMYSVVKAAYRSYHKEAWRDKLNEMGKLLWMQREKGKVFDVSWYEKEDDK